MIPWTQSPPGFSIHGIFQARILEWVAICSFRGSSWPMDPIHISCSSCIASWFFTPEPSANCFPNWLNYQLPTGNCIRVPGTLLPWQSSLFCLNFSHSEAYVGFPGGSDGKESTCSEGDLSSIPGLGKPPGEGNSYPIFWPGEFHGQRSLESYSPWGWKEWRTEQPSHTNVYICKYRGRDISLHF